MLFSIITMPWSPVFEMLLVGIHSLDNPQLVSSRKTSPANFSCNSLLSTYNHPILAAQNCLKLRDAIHCDRISSIIFREIWFNNFSSTKCTINSDVCGWIAVSTIALVFTYSAILLVDVTIELEVGLVAEDFTGKFVIYLSLFVCPIGKCRTLKTVE